MGNICQMHLSVINSNSVFGGGVLNSFHYIDQYIIIWAYNPFIFYFLYYYDHNL